MITAAVRRMTLPERYDFSATVGQIQINRWDPCAQVAAGGFWLAARTPEGPGTLNLRRDGRELVVTAYGPGAGWMLDQAGSIAGLYDDVTGFAELAARHPVVAELARQHAGFRLPATGCVYSRLLRAIIEQKVTGKEAHRSYSKLVRYFARDEGPAPGPLETLLLPPDPQQVAATPYWVLHRFGVEQRRADTICRAAAQAQALEASRSPAELTARLTAIPGIGAWTAAEVVRTVFGDPDAVSIGDWNMPHIVSWALAGQARAGAREAPAPGRLSPADERMLQLLEPFRGHRARVCLLLRLGGFLAPRFGPRAPIRSFASF